MDPEKIIDIGKKIISEIELLNNHLLEKYPVDLYISLFNKTRKYAPYKRINSKIKNFGDIILEKGGEELLALYHKLVLINLIKDAEKRIDDHEFPDGISEISKNYFERLILRFHSETTTASSKYYQLSNDKFIKDIGICRFSLIIAGPVLLDTGYFPLKYLLKKGVKPFMKGLFILIKYRSLAPVFKMHTHISNPVLMSNFTEEGWVRFYYNVAELMLHGNNSRGIYCAGWFFDPALQNVSPEMAYLSKLVLSIGGELFYLGSDAKIIKDATFLNRQRKKLYEEGQYKPSRYVIFIPRKKLITWYKSGQFRLFG